MSSEGWGCTLCGVTSFASIQLCRAAGCPFWARQARVSNEGERPTVPEGCVALICVTKQITGYWHDDTWYRVGDYYLAVPTVEPLTPGWVPITTDHSGTIAAAHVNVVAYYRKVEGGAS